MVDLVRDVVLVVRADGALIEANDTAVQLYGYSRDELVGMNIAQLRAPDTHERLDDQLREAGLGGAFFDTRHVAKDGRVIDVEVSARGSDAASGRVIVSIIRDVTEHRRALEALRRSEANFRAVLDNSPDAIAVCVDEEFSYVNPAWVSLLRFADASALVGRPIYDVIHPQEHAEVRARNLARVAGEAKPRVERRLLRCDGSIAVVSITNVGLFIEGRPSTLIHARDLTGQKALESQLAIADRMTSVGILAAGVAHEINNPLSYVTNNVEFARSEVQAILGMVVADSPVGRRLNEMAQALREAELGAERVRQIVLDLKTFSRIDDQHHGPLDVRKTLELAISMATNEIRHRARLVFQPAPAPKVDANEAKLGQVFLNVLINAAQAIPEGRADSHTIRVGLGTDSKLRAVITITDDGEGIPAEIRDRVFDPFFTTKPQGIGTGLGLAICHNIVRSLQGEITLESEVGKGTTVRIVLPGAASALQRISPTKPSLIPRPSRARIVLIDDEPMIGVAVRRILEKEHDVVLISSARDAFDRIVAGEHFDVILCDLMMPEMTGMDLYEALAQAAPEQAQRMRFVTGGTFTERARRFVDERADRVIQKPFRASQLRKLISSMFEGA